MGGGCGIGCKYVGAGDGNMRIFWPPVVEGGCVTSCKGNQSVSSILLLSATSQSNRTQTLSPHIIDSGRDSTVQKEHKEQEGEGVGTKI